MITKRDIAILLMLVRYYVLNRMQIQRLCFPGDETGRVTRRRIQTLVDAKLIGKTLMQVVNPLAGTAAPVYFPSRKGTEFLAEYCGDDRYHATPMQTPQSHHLFHWLAVSETHIALDQAIASQKGVELVDWLSEWDTANKDESAPEKRFRIYTLIQETPRLVCAPDAAFVLALGGQSMVYYLEQDRNTSGVNQIAASKTPGYAAMAERQLHRNHFPQVTTDAFRVLMIAPNERRRDSLKRVMRDKPGSALWRFASALDATPEKILFTPIWHPLRRRSPRPLVKLESIGATS